VALAHDEALPAAVIERSMHADDVAAVGMLERASYQFPWSEPIFHDCLRVGYVCRVIEAADRIIGYGIASMAAGEAHILNLCVAEAIRGRGVARRLLLSLLKRAERAGQQWAFLEVRPSNAPALRLYRDLGFVEVGRRRDYYQAVGGREDAIVCRLALTAAALRDPES
jgi:[ribosomal protein S18]-alanine N-acetyltransferase